MKFVLDATRTRLAFSVKHMMIHTVRGAFSDVTADIDIDPARLEAGSASARIGTASVDTKDRLRDEYLKSSYFFKPEQFPHLSFKSTSVRPRGSKISVSGLLTVRDRERQLILEGTHTDLGSSGGKRRLRFELQGEIDREAYDLTFHGAVETVSVVVGKKVKLDLSIEVVQA